MSFLDNLENNLKAMEEREERGPDGRRQPTQREREVARAVQPHAEQLRRSTFVTELLDHVVKMAHGLRTKVYINWMGNALRLDAKDRRLELQPTADGIAAVFSLNHQETARRMIDLKGDAGKLAQEFLGEVKPAR